MTVKDLILKLSEFDPELEVHYEDMDLLLWPVEDIVQDGSKIIVA